MDINMIRYIFWQKYRGKNEIHLVENKRGDEEKI